MAITYSLKSSNAGGSYNGGPRYMLVYEVYNDSGLLGGQTACNAVNWNYGDYYNNPTEGEWDHRALCVDINGDEASEDGRTRFVTVEFRIVTEEEKQKTQNPFMTIKESFLIQNKGELPLEYDSNYMPIVNRAGDRISGVTEAVYNGVYKLTINYPFPPLQIIYFAGRVNGDWWRGFSPRTLKLIGVDEIQSEFSADWGTYYPLGMQFEFNPMGHQQILLNEGYRERNQQGELEHILVDGEKTTSPMLLTANGQLASPAQGPIWLQYHTTFALPYSYIA